MLNAEERKWRRKETSVANDVNQTSINACNGARSVHRRPAMAQREKSLWAGPGWEAEIYRWPLYLAVAACDRNSIKYPCNKQGKRKFIWNGLAPAAGSLHAALTSVRSITCR